MTAAPPLSAGDERVFTLSDVRKLLQSRKRKIIRIALIGAACGFGMAIVEAPIYQIQATFKEGKDGQHSEGFSLSQIVGGGGSNAEGQTPMLMQSDQVLRPLAARLGLQATVPKSRTPFRYFRIFRDNLKAERGKTISDPDDFVFRDVQYDGMQALSYTLRFDDLEHFSIFAGKEAIASGSIGKEVRLPEAALTLAAAPKGLKIGRSYRLCIHPWFSITGGIRSRLKIVNKFNKTIYTLIYQTPDRHLGVRLVNELMAQYRSYLKRDHDELAQEQLSYLEQKQEEIYGKLSGVFDDYTDYLWKNLRDHGSMGLEQEIQSITENYRKMSSRIQSIDLELNRIALMEKEGKMSLSEESSPFANELQRNVYVIQDLKQQRDLLELSLQQNKLPDYADAQYQERRDELRRIRERCASAKSLLDAVEKGSTFLAPEFDLSGSLTQWAARLNESQAEEREDLAEYLENYLHLLSMQGKIAQERVFYEEDIPPELQGIDLETARTLFVEYNKSLDEHVAAMRHFDQLGKEIQKNDFAISSLSTVLADPLSQHLISKASDTVLQLKDEKHRSEKEGERWKEELGLQKKILADHLEQLYEVERLNATLVREKITGLQQLSLGCINGQISVLRERLGTMLRDRRSDLLQEKQILEKALEGLRHSFGDLPDQWRREKWMDLKTDMGVTMISSVTELVESKTIGHHLHHVESKMLDAALLPSAPCKPGLFTFSFLGALLASFGVVCHALLSAILRDFPPSSEKFRAMRYPFLGEIAPFCDGPAVGELTGPDLDLLRQISLFIERPPQGKIVGLLAGKGPDYSYAIGENLARMGRRSLIVRCDFGAKFKSEDQPGLLQIWKGETGDLPIRRGNGYDLLTSGGFTPYGTEIVQSDAFKNLLDLCKKNYDVIFLLFRSPLDTAEPIAALSLCEKAIVTAVAEPTEQLTPFVDWAYHEGICRLAFILATPR